MASATVIEKYISDFFCLTDNKKTDSKFGYTSITSFTRSGYYKHQKSKNHSLKAGETSKWEMYQKYFK